MTDLQIQGAQNFGGGFFFAAAGLLLLVATLKDGTWRRSPVIIVIALFISTVGICSLAVGLGEMLS